MPRGLAVPFALRPAPSFDWAATSFKSATLLAPGTLVVSISDPTATGAFALGHVTASSSGGGSSSVSVSATSIASAGGGAFSTVTTSATGDAVSGTVGVGTLGAGGDWAL